MTLLHRLSLLILALTLGPIMGPGTAAAETLAAWVQLIGPGRDASIRVITDGAPCPMLKADGADLPMQVRAKPGRLFKRGTRVPRAEFEVLVCEAIAPPGKASVLLDGKPLPVPPADIRRIVVFGDTGCRIKKTKIQDCKLDWPYEMLASHAAQAHPDLIIHVGDYLYRESCTAGKAKCPKTQTGYGWDVWNEDFFTPSAPLFAAAPWIMVRGNHETCVRAGEGWFRFLDHARPAAECTPMSGFFIVALGDLGFVVMDSGQIADDKGIDTEDDDDEDDGDTAAAPLPRNVAGAIRRNYAEVARRVPSPAWLLTHAPFNAVKLGKTTGKDQVVNTIQQRAIGDLLPKDIEMIVSGHVHMFEALSFADANPPRAPQLVVGTGGVKLAKKPDKPADIDGIPVVDPFILKDFAYIVWDRNGTSWDGKLFDADGAKIARCTLADRTLACKKE
jgi:calcineurin-like phosphoesterase family protein